MCIYSFMHIKTRCRIVETTGIVVEPSVVDSWPCTCDYCPVSMLAFFRHQPIHVIFCRHAGYQYCGACGGHAYRQVSPVVVKRIFILGPSHHVRLSGCALSSAQKYKTPIYDLHVDGQGMCTNMVWIVCGSKF